MSKLLKENYDWPLLLTEFCQFKIITDILPSPVLEMNTLCSTTYRSSFPPVRQQELLVVQEGKSISSEVSKHIKLTI